MIIAKLLFDKCIQNNKKYLKIELDPIIKKIFGTDSLSYYEFLQNYDSHEDFDFKQEEIKKVKKFFEIGLKHLCYLNVY